MDVGLKLTCTPAVNVSLSPVHLSFLLRQNLNKLAELVRGGLPKLIHNIIGALITIDVHARDIVTQMVHNKVTTLYSTCELENSELDKTMCIDEEQRSHFEYCTQFFNFSVVVNYLADKLDPSQYYWFQCA